ncbi:hypothetical protein BV22DRAFT_1007913 [Leucogyrophana mollusca]|uniref:Uncharacterized protein n=1 Tax=Leucogyrophana mollusca TaxID=85980 RepID=A0ACB8BM07_9AGAM|nr:hypothetical protein BV22DRAFT_1007913 [Leucogyrophana mollusca]
MDVDIDFPVPFHCPQLAPMSINGWDYSGVPELVSLPDGMTSDDVEELKSDLRVVHAATSPVDRERCIRQLALAWEDYFLPKYPVPFFEVRVADVRAVGGSLSTALQLYDEARCWLSSISSIFRH